MTNEQKELLIKDICARLPYGIKAQNYEDESPYIIVGYEDSYFSDNDGRVYKADEIKPYLFPLSSMTEEQEKELNLYLRLDKEPIMRSVKEIDWYNKNHFDYRGLIEKGLAIDATGLNIY